MRIRGAPCVPFLVQRSDHWRHHSWLDSRSRWPVLPCAAGRRTAAGRVRPEDPGLGRVWVRRSESRVPHLAHRHSDRNDRALQDEAGACPCPRLSARDTPLDTSTAGLSIKACATHADFWMVESVRNSSHFPRILTAASNRCSNLEEITTHKITHGLEKLRYSGGSASHIARSSSRVRVLLLRCGNG